VLWFLCFLLPGFKGCNPLGRVVAVADEGGFIHSPLGLPILELLAARKARRDDLVAHAASQQQITECSKVISVFFLPQLRPV